MVAVEELRESIVEISGANLGQESDAAVINAGARNAVDGRRAGSPQQRAVAAKCEQQVRVADRLRVVADVPRRAHPGVVTLARKALPHTPGVLGRGFDARLIKKSDAHPTTASQERLIVEATPWRSSGQGGRKSTKVSRFPPSHTRP